MFGCNVALDVCLIAFVALDACYGSIVGLLPCVCFYFIYHCALPLFYGFNSYFVRVSTS